MNNIDLSNISKKEWRKVRSKYVNTSFDFDDREEALLLVRTILEKHKLRFWLTNGTALAARRSGTWILWDDDVDIDVMMEDYLRVHDNLRSDMIAAGFIVRSTKHPQRGKMSLFWKGEKIAIRPLYLDKSYKSNKFRLRNNYKYPKRFYEGKHVQMFLGEYWPVPGPIDEFLEYVYGSEWIKPMKSDNEKEYSTSKIRR